jgi:hypothetical protein
MESVPMETGSVTTEPVTTAAEQEMAPDPHITARKLTYSLMSQLFTAKEMTTSVSTADHPTKNQIDQIRLGKVVGMLLYSEDKPKFAFIH